MLSSIEALERTIKVRPAPSRSERQPVIRNSQRRNTPIIRRRRIQRIVPQERQSRLRDPIINQQILAHPRTRRLRGRRRSRRRRGSSPGRSRSSTSTAELCLSQLPPTTPTSERAPHKRSDGLGIGASPGCPWNRNGLGGTGQAGDGKVERLVGAGTAPPTLCLNLNRHRAPSRTLDGERKRIEIIRHGISARKGGVEIRVCVGRKDEFLAGNVRRDRGHRSIIYPIPSSR